MAHLELTKTRIHGGRYEAVLRSDQGMDTPKLSATHLGRGLDGLSILADPDTPQRWFVTLDIPAQLLSDGIQTILIVDEETGETLDNITLVTGEPLTDDLRSEIDLLRAELDLLKRSFRRHCRDTSQS